MADFGSLAAFASHLAKLTVSMHHAEHEAMERAAKIVEDEAKRVLGTHDYNWPPLKPETIAHKATGDSPLLETGEMRDSIEHSVGRHGVFGAVEAHIGSNSDTALWHEIGTSKVPPRPFLTSAAMQKEREVVDILGEGAVRGITQARHYPANSTTESMPFTLR